MRRTSNPSGLEGLLDLSDSRTVAWAAWGLREGTPILRCHGTPGSRLMRNPDDGIYTRSAAHVVTFDRPGYGLSTPHWHQTLLEAANDALALADAFGWDQFAVLGISGGGPHALALAVQAPDRIRSLALAVGAMPPELVRDDELIPINREAKRIAAEQGRPGLEALLAGPAQAIAADPIAALKALMAESPRVDRDLLEQPAVQTMMADSLREAFRRGPAGWFQDSWLLQRSWGFELADVQAPVHLWYGEDDRNVPVRAARAMAAELTVASFETIADAGHLGWLAHEETIIRTLLDSTRRSG
jgi:pimeloyl-ACP methyl ester carboxylesterase